MQLVRDEDHGASVLGHGADRLEQCVCLLRCEDRGRLVQDEDARVAIERLHDLDALLFPERELPDARAGIDREPEALRELGDAPLDRALVEQKAAPDVAVVAEHDVLRDRERRHETKMLVDHRDARVEGVARRMELSRLSEENDLPLVGAVQAREDVGERRLAGAVLSEQRMDLALRRLEVDAVVRDDAGEPFRDSPQRHRRLHGSSGGRGSLNLPAQPVSPWRCRSRP